MQRRAVFALAGLIAVRRKLEDKVVGRSEVLYRDSNVTLDSNGNGQITFGPTKRGETWRIDRMLTNGSSTSEPEVNVYRNSITLNGRVDFTPFGNDDISETTTELRLQDNDRLIVVYSSGSNGAVMTYRIEGAIEYRTIGGRDYSAL